MIFQADSLLCLTVWQISQYFQVQNPKISSNYLDYQPLKKGHSITQYTTEVGSLGFHVLFLYR